MRSRYETTPGRATTAVFAAFLTPPLMFSLSFIGIGLMEQIIEGKVPRLPSLDALWGWSLILNIFAWPVFALGIFIFGMPTWAILHQYGVRHWLALPLAAAAEGFLVGGLLFGFENPGALFLLVVPSCVLIAAAIWRIAYRRVDTTMEEPPRIFLPDDFSHYRNNGN